MSEQIQVPMPRAGWNCELRGGRSYPIDEYLALIEPRYRVYEEQVRRCISGLTTYAAQQAAAHKDAQLPMLRDLVMELASFWNLDGDLDKDSDERMERQYGGGFDQAVLSARQSGQPPALTDQEKQDVLTGLEVHTQEMSNNGDDDRWIQRNSSLVQQLRDEWQMEQAPAQQDVLTITMGGMA